MTMDFKVDREDNTFRFYRPDSVSAVTMTQTEAEDFANKILDAIENIKITRGG